MAVHELKTWPEYFSEVFAGRKKFEIRKNDRNYQVNDILILQEWDAETQEYTGGDYVCRITYILDVPDFVKDEMVVMSIEPYSTFFDSDSTESVIDDMDRRIKELEGFLKTLRSNTPYGLYKEQITKVLKDAQEWPCTCGNCDGEHYGFAIKDLPKAIGSTEYA